MVREVETLQAEVERLRMLQLSRADIVASVTHEMKTPLTSLLGYTMMLRKREDVITPEQRREFIEVIERQGQRMLTLIENMLQSQRLEEGEATLQRVPLDLVAIAERVAAEMSEPRERTVLVEGPTEDLGLYGDPASVEHILTNLIDNALKFSPNHEPVFVRITPVGGGVDMSVTDRGKGIEESEQETIFDRFRQASNSQGRGSVGLGLHIVKSLVEAHRGMVSVASQQGHGATFTVTFPRRLRSI